MVPGLGKALFSFLLPLPPARQPGGLAQPPPQLHAQLRASPRLQAPASLTTHQSGGTVSNPFLPIFHIICKLVLPHAAPGAATRTFQPHNPSPFSHSTKLPGAPGCRCPPRGAQHHRGTSWVRGNLHGLSQMQTPGKESSRVQVPQASCCATRLCPGSWVPAATGSTASTTSTTSSQSTGTRRAASCT